MKQVYKIIIDNLSKDELLILIDSLTKILSIENRPTWLTLIYLSIQNHVIMRQTTIVFDTRCRQCYGYINKTERFTLNYDFNVYWQICKNCAIFNHNLPTTIGSLLFNQYLNKIILLNDLLIKDVIYYIDIKMIC